MKYNQCSALISYCDFIFIASLLNKIIASIVCNLISTTVILNVWSTDCPLNLHTIFEQNENADVTIKVAMTQDSVGEGTEEISVRERWLNGNG
jgi:hypothetical protein